MIDHTTLEVSNMVRNECSRKMVFELLQYMRVFSTTFDKDPCVHAFNSGLRSAGLRLESMIKEHAINEYFKMIRENSE